MSSDEMKDRNDHRSTGEAAYRRGFCQGIQFLLDWARFASEDEVDRVFDARDEAMRMRYDSKPHPAFMDELEKRLED